MNVIAPGSKVTMSGDVQGVVTQANICGGNHVRYEVVWWDGNTRHCCWVECHEVTAAGDTPSVRIGFQQ